MEGKTVSHYKVLEKIGEGGMGEVYLAEDSSLKRKVALKFLPEYLQQDEVAHKRFLREAQSAAALDHPFICKIYETDEAEGVSFIAMEYVKGQTLKEKLSEGRLSLKETLQIGSEVAEALEKAHKSHIVHRDLKPANIMLTEEGHAKVMDFGLAKHVSTTDDLEGEITAALTQEGTTLGTLNYMSPEQLRGQPVDTRTDIFSFGIVLYEMLTAVNPFKKQTRTETIGAILTDSPPPLDEMRSEVTPDLQRIITRALEKDPELRYSSAAEMRDELSKCRLSLQVSEGGLVNIDLLLRRVRQPLVAVPAILLIALIGFATFWFLSRQAKINWARGDLLPKVDQLIEAGWENYIAAYKVATEAEIYLPDDPRLAEFFERIATHISIRTEPPGAKISVKEYSTPERGWQYLGDSPIKGIRLPIGLFQWKMEKQGYETVFAAAPTYRGALEVRWSPHDIVRTLDEKKSIPIGMARVEGESGIADFFFDRHEVTNRQFREFVNGGGYQKKEYWREEFLKDGEKLSWEEALEQFVDQTGQPGPATWIAGDFPENQADYPVSGVSWYEAAAYAEFMGKSLPTVAHWGIARGEYTPLIKSLDFGASVGSLSNFKGEGSAPVGSNSGMTAYGAYDLAGNVREWCWNESPDGRIVRGGAWNDAIYMFQDLSQATPFDRSPRNGFRCARYLNPDSIPKSVFDKMRVHKEPDFYRLEPVSDPVFQAYKEQFSYDKTDLNSRIEWRDESSADWVQEKITFNAAYDNERVIAYLFLPRNSSPPYQTVIYFPGMGPSYLKSSQNLDQYGEFQLHLSYIVRRGRAVLFPVYKATFERNVDWKGFSPRQCAELQIKVVKDLKRSIDYLETRRDIDSQRIAYYGYSWGGWYGAIIPAVEERLKTNILHVGGFLSSYVALIGPDKSVRPEMRQINYVTRVKIPTLMLNGRYDMSYPHETTVKPMFDLLGTPEDQKVLKPYNTDHFVPRNELIKETLSWLDRYLGPVQRE